MYVVLKNNIAVAYENRNLSLNDMVHPSLHHLYIEIANETEVELGDIWHPDTLTWEKPEIIEDIEEIVEE